MKKFYLFTISLFISIASYSQNLESDSLKLDHLLTAIRWVESRNDDSVISHKGAIGPLQITPICLREVNRLQSNRIYTREDCFKWNESVEIFFIIADHYTPDYNFEKLCRRWYGGPNGDKKTSTINYWKQVKLKFNELQDDKSK